VCQRNGRGRTLSRLTQYSLRFGDYHSTARAAEARAVLRPAPHVATSEFGPSVWTGRALQAESDDLEKLVLRFCIRPIEGAFEPLAIMDIRARSISFASRPQRAIRAT
jgi:hypothetical protein